MIDLEARDHHPKKNDAMARIASTGSRLAVEHLLSILSGFKQLCVKFLHWPWTKLLGKLAWEAPKPVIGDRYVMGRGGMCSLGLLLTKTQMLEMLEKDKC